MKGIVLVPRLYNPGGVANYYSVLRPYFKGRFTYVYRGKSDKNILWRFITDYFNFYIIAYKLRHNDGAVLISTSLEYGGFFRDGLYSIITPKKFKRIIFFRGWNPSFEKEINNFRILKFWLHRTFLKADHIIVLSSEFKKNLREWGYTGKISIETTVVDEKLLKEFKFSEKKSDKKNILFLSRIEKAKGIFEAVEAVNILLKQGKDIQFDIAGDGSVLKELNDHISNLNTTNINLKGYVKGKNKFECFSTANLFIFPSVHGEGMPNSILEAMAFGLPVLTTRVGGIPDFFEEGKMGLFLESRKPEHIAAKVEYLLERPELMKEMSNYNYNYAKEHFYASKVARRLQEIIDRVIKNTN